MSSESINWVKKEYCLTNKKSRDNITLRLHSRRSNGDYIFLVEEKGGDVTSYIHPRINLSANSDYTALNIPTEYDADKNFDKNFISNWFYKQTGFRLIDEDISFITVEKTKVSVVIARDSMRFMGDFSLTRTLREI